MTIRELNSAGMEVITTDKSTEKMLLEVAPEGLGIFDRKNLQAYFKNFSFVHDQDERQEQLQHDAYSTLLFSGDNPRFFDPAAHNRSSSLEEKRERIEVAIGILRVTHDRSLIASSLVARTALWGTAGPHEDESVTEKEIRLFAARSLYGLDSNLSLAVYLALTHERDSSIAHPALRNLAWLNVDMGAARAFQLVREADGNPKIQAAALQTLSENAPLLAKRIATELKATHSKELDAYLDEIITADPRACRRINPLIKVTPLDPEFAGAAKNLHAAIRGELPENRLRGLFELDDSHVRPQIAAAAFMGGILDPSRRVRSFIVDRIARFDENIWQAALGALAAYGEREDIPLREKLRSLIEERSRKDGDAIDELTAPDRRKFA